jgi:superfamily II DNA or RNA helicase
MKLRLYQDNVIDQFERKIAEGIRRIIIVAPTGAGKTVIASEIIMRAVAKSRRVLFIAHRDELLTQARDKLKSFEVTAGIIKAGRDKDARPQALVQVAGIQTLHARAVRAQTMELPPAEIVFVDEAHHCRAMTYQTIIDAYPNAIIIGLTATPCRGDGKGLGNIFQAMIECPQIGELIELGHLVKLKIFAPPPPDLRGVRVMSTGDYNTDELSAKMDPLVGDFVEHWLRHAQRRRTVVFAVDVKHSVHIVDELRKSGVKAEHLDASTSQDEREAILGRLASGETEVVSNCMILTEGFDLPDIGCNGHLRMKGMACDNCGWEPKPPARAVEYIDGELVELGKPAVVPSDTERKIFYAELRGYQQSARKKDGTPYANGWAANQYRTKHGSYPPWSWNDHPPVTPSPATLRWIKSRQIAWARARSAG